MSRLFVGSGLFLLDTLASGWFLTAEGATSHALFGALLLSVVGSIPLAAGWATALFEGKT